ncbi:MAG: hypothetical protein ACT4OF_15235 [Caulobacteraceae bacterium]
MRRRTILLSMAASCAMGGCGEAIDRAALDGAPVAVTVIDEGLSALTSEFNTARNKVRLLFLVGPSCGPCLRGLMELSEALGSDLLSDQRLRVLVVHVPTLGAEEDHARRAVGLMRGDSVSHYWDPSGESGNVVQRALGVSQYAWDVWLTYPPGPIWDSSALPAPAEWAHQLGGLAPERRLNAEAFAADVRARVSALT